MLQPLLTAGVSFRPSVVNTRYLSISGTQEMDASDADFSIQIWLGASRQLVDGGKLGPLVRQLPKWCCLTCLFRSVETYGLRHSDMPFAMQSFASVSTCIVFDVDLNI